MKILSMVPAILASAGVLAAAAAVAAAAWYGAFAPVRVRAEEAGGELAVFEELRGDYRQAGTAGDRVYYTLLRDGGLETFLGFGVFYDDPRAVPTAELRSRAGCIVPEDKRPVAAEAFAKAAAAARERGEPALLMEELPRGAVLAADLPFRGPPSLFFGLLKAYPALRAEAARRGLRAGAAAEIYDVPARTVRYRLHVGPLAP